MTLSLPRFQQASDLVDSTGKPSNAFHIWWDEFAGTLETNFNDLASTVQALSDLNNDNILTPAKKPQWIMLYTNITSEQSDIDTLATTYGITTEKTNYDNAVSTLTSYLATLTTPVAWDNLTGNTDIVGTTFRGDFNSVFSTKQLLLDKIHNSAKTLADSAQSTANTANTAATNAQTTADTVNRNDSISTSWTSPGTILSAHDTGSNASITISNHTRKYSDATSKSVTGATINSLSYSTKYYIYYDDSNRSGGAVTFHATTNPNTALSNGTAGRHFCGSITTPASGAGDTSGSYDPPSGGGGVIGGEIP